MTTSFQPVSSDERLRTLDVLRGAALLGIVLMNIVFSGLPFAAYANPNLWGGNDPLNVGVLAVQWVLFDGKMRALFSMMFGAGIVLFMQRALERENSVRAADLLSRRMLWLILFGALHGWLIWAGDILYAYGLFGLLILPMRNVSPRKLFITSGVVLLLLSLAIVGRGFSQRSTRNAAMAARAVEAQGQASDERAAGRQEGMGRGVQRGPAVQGEAAGGSGQLPEGLRWRDDAARADHAEVQLRAGLFSRQHRYLGAHADRHGAVQAGRACRASGRLRFYVRLAAAGYGIGIAVNTLSTYGMITSNYDIVATMFWNTPYQIGRVAVALGHASVLILLVKGARMRWLTDRLAAVGQMAFSNYISHSIIYALFFYAPGLRMFGQLQRYQLYYVVLGYLDPQPGVESDLAALLPLRPARVVLALVDLLAAAADAANGPGSRRRVRGGVIW